MSVTEHEVLQGGDAIADKERTFRGFLKGVLWFVTHVLQAIALLSVAFAVRAGWWAGWVCFVVIGLAIGVAFRQRGAYWAFQAAEGALLLAGGAVAALFQAGG